MKRTDIAEFLRGHQPMPPNGEIDQALATRYDYVRKWVKDQGDLQVLMLFFGSFGAGDGLGMYQLVEGDVLEMDHEAVVPALVANLRSPHQSVRHWCAEIAAAVPDARLVDPLRVLLAEGNYDTRYATLIALEKIGTEAANAVMNEHLHEEKDPELITLLQEILGIK